MADPFKAGLEQIRSARFFEAHEELETAWRAAPAGERDFYQGLVHVAVAWYQAGRGRPIATARQLEKAARRLAQYAPSHRGVVIARPNATPALRKAAPRPSAYAARRAAPFSAVPVLLASTSTAASTVPMHGAAQTAKAPPSKAPEPRRRAPTSSPGATTRSGIGSRPTNARPRTTSTKPATSVCAPAETVFPIAAAPAPRTTKTTVNPSTNGMLATSTRRVVPVSPSRPGSTLESADRQPGTSGSTHGVITDASPAGNATASRTPT